MDHKSGMHCLVGLDLDGPSRFPLRLHPPNDFLNPYSLMADDTIDELCEMPIFFEDVYIVVANNQCPSLASKLMVDELKLVSDDMSVHCDLRRASHLSGSYNGFFGSSNSLCKPTTLSCRSLVLELFTAGADSLRLSKFLDISFRLLRMETKPAHTELVLAIADSVVDCESVFEDLVTKLAWQLQKA